MEFAAILLKVEGALSPAAYIQDKLFTFAYRRLPQFLIEYREKEEVGRAISSLQLEQQQSGFAQSKTSREDLQQPGFADIVDYCLWMISNRRRSVALQGMLELVWRRGFLSGELCSDIFADVPSAFQRWRRLNHKVATCSWLSAGTQELFFRFSEWGDLTPYVNFFFNSRGPRDLPGYQRIINAFQCRPAEVLFVSDAPIELDAAHGMGMGTALVGRTRTAPVASAIHRLVPDLSDLLLE
jgi:enolase-phosphatase E1